LARAISPKTLPLIFLSTKNNNQLILIPITGKNININLFYQSKILIAKNASFFPFFLNFSSIFVKKRKK